MGNIAEYTAAFQSITARVLEDMFGTVGCHRSPVVELPSVITSKSFIVSLFYTGTVYGEYLLAMDEQVAARTIGIDQPIDDASRADVRTAICDALSETLNVIVGEAIVELQSCYSKLTITAPRVYFGEIRYPHFHTGKAVLSTTAGDVECFFCLDQMRLSLAESYDDAMSSLVEINNQLKQALQHLAEQQAQLVHTEKMASIGVLASGVAHEINNPLFFVDMNLEVLDANVAVIESLIRRYENLEASIADRADDLPNEHHDFGSVLRDTKEIVAEARDGVDRIKRIVTSLKEFSDIDRTGSAATDVNLVAKNACGLVSHLLPANCQVQLQLETLPKVYCNAGEIGQVLANVVTNAAQAVGDDGQIVVRSQADEDSVVFTIEDNGCGIDPDDVDRLFDPFFTTRAEGEGKGLGLSISYGLVRKHGGTIAISSQPGAGTTVSIRLPVAAQAAYS